MQEEFDAEDELITSLAQEPAPGDTFDCGICLEKFQTGALAPMDGCNHPYCRECMRDYVQSKLGSRSFPILCPTCHATKGGGTQGGGYIPIVLISLLNIWVTF
jgi:E3 ubiquitin-protein ligase RNF217